MELLKDLIDSKILNIMQLFLNNKTKYFHLTDIADKANVPSASTFRLIRKLVALGFVEYTKTGKLKLYKLSDNKKSRKFEEILRLKI